MTARTFAAFSFTFLLSMFFRTFFAVAGPALAQELSLSPVEFGTLSSAFFACFAAMQVPVGILFDRFGCRLPMAALVSCGAIGAVMIATSSSFAQAVVGQGLLGIGCSPALMGIYFFYGRVLSWEKAARVTTMIAAIGSLGAFISATPFELLVSEIGWRYGVGVSATCMICAACLLFVSVPRNGYENSASSGAEAPSSTNARFLLFLAPIFLSASLGTVFRSAWASPYLIDVVQASSREAANIFTAVSVAGTLTGFALPFALKRLSPTSIVGVLYGLAIALTAALALDPDRDIFFAGAVFSILYAVGNCHTIALAEAQAHISSRRRGTILGILNGLGFVGVASVSPVFGLIAKALDPVPAFAAMFSGTAAALLISFVVYLRRNQTT